MCSGCMDIRRGLLDAERLSDGGGQTALSGAGVVVVALARMSASVTRGRGVETAASLAETWAHRTTTVLYFNDKIALNGETFRT